MIVGVLAGRDVDGNLLPANDIVREPDVVEVVHFDHQMIESLFRSSEPESHRVVAVVAMHEDDRERLLAHPDFVFDATTHPQLAIKAVGGIGVLFTDDAVAETAAPGLEPSVHPAARMERFAELNLWSVENFDRIAIGVFKLHDFKDVTLRGFAFRTDSKLDPGLLQLVLHLAEFLAARYPEAEIHKIVGRVGMKSDAMMPVIHPKVAAVAFTVVHDFEPYDFGGEPFPRLEVFHPEPYVSELCYLGHCLPPDCHARASVFTKSDPNATRRTESVSLPGCPTLCAGAGASATRFDRRPSPVTSTSTRS